MKYFVSKIDVDYGWSKFFTKGWGHLACRHDFARIEKKKQKGYLPFYDRNKDKFMWVKIIEQSKDKLGYVVEAKRINTYWKNCFSSLTY